jgi:hypothetical protein
LTDQDESRSTRGRFEVIHVSLLQQHAGARGCKMSGRAFENEMGRPTAL